MSAPPLPTQLTYGRIRWTVIGLDTDTDLDLDDLPDVVSINGRAYVTADVDRDAILGQGLVVPTTILTKRTELLIVNGRLQDRAGNTDVKLLANDSPGINPTGWSYTIEYELDDGYTFGSFSFSLSTNELVDLTEEIPFATPSPGVVELRGPAGPPGEGYGGGLVVGPTDLVNPLQVSIASNWGLTDGGVAYYDPQGAVPEEAALLVPDFETASFGLFRPGPIGSGGSAPAGVFQVLTRAQVESIIAARADPLDTRVTAAEGDLAAIQTELGEATPGHATNNLVERDANGGFAAKSIYGLDDVAASAADVAANKGYVDDQIATRLPTTQKGAASGLATLGVDGKIPTAQLPSLAITDTFVVASQAAMLALNAQRGDVAVRTDLVPVRLFILTTDNPGTLADWREFTAAGAVTSVDGLSGAVSLGATAATNNSLARRTATGTVAVANAATNGEAMALGQSLSFGRDRGTGTNLPTTDLRRGDVYFHTGIGLHVYTGTEWRLSVRPSTAVRIDRKQSISADTNLVLVANGAYVAPVSPGEITLTAQAGEWVRIGMGFGASNDSGDLRVDVATINAGAIASYISGAGAGGNGIAGWTVPATRFEQGAGSMVYKLLPADVATEGTVTLRMLMKAQGAARTVFRGPNDLVIFYAEVIR